VCACVGIRVGVSVDAVGFGAKGQQFCRKPGFGGCQRSFPGGTGRGIQDQRKW